MDVFEAMHTRRSIRKFQQKPISADVVRDLLGAAMMAPSAGNQQPWQFVVISDAQMLGKVPTINPHADMAAQAPLAILVCGDLSLEKYAGFWVQDCSAATQNLLLAAHGKGLGGVWTAVYPIQDRVEAFKRLCSLPETVVPLVLVVLGYPAESPDGGDRFLPDRVHRNSWSSR
jgi:nitroreductase